MRMHEASVHKLYHIAHAYLPGTNCPYCMREYNTKDKAFRHLKTTKTCLSRLRFYRPNGLGHQAETAEGLELARLKAAPMFRLPGPVQWEANLHIGPLPPPLKGYITSEQLANRTQNPNQDPDDQNWGSVEDLREQARSTNNIRDITPFLGPIRAIVLFYGGRRRQGDVAHFCELSVAGRAVEGFRLVVCVVDIVHGPKHDISRGGANFVWDQVKGGRVAAIGAAPPC